MKITGPSLERLDQLGDALAADVARSLRAVCRQTAKHLTGAPSLDDVGVIIGYWRARSATLLRHVADAYDEAGRHVAAQIDAAMTADAGDQQQDQPPAGVTRDAMAEHYLSGASNRLVNVGNLIWEQTRDQLLEGIQHAEGVPQLADRVARVAPQLAEPRATVIARTEIVGASNAGAIDRVRAYGVATTKTWLATGDGKTRPDHVSADGQTVGIDERFMVGGISMDRPHDLGAPAGEVVNCRCTMTFTVPDEQLTAAADVMDGAMLALVPSDEDADRLAIDGYEPLDRLHLTLLYLGQAADWSTEARASLIEWMRRLFTGFGDIDGAAFGANFWNPDSDTPSWVLPIGDVSTSLGRLYEAKQVADTAVIETTGKPELPAQHTPWVPHVCLAYTGDTAPLADMIKRTGPVMFDRARVAFGGQVTDIPLGS